eukprot:768074-Hanusia_phi.AAC.9
MNVTQTTFISSTHRRCNLLLCSLLPSASSAISIDIALVTCTLVLVLGARSACCQPRQAARGEGSSSSRSLRPPSSLRLLSRRKLRVPTCRCTGRSRWGPSELSR